MMSVNMNVDCLHPTQKTGGIIVKCRHYAHQKCLNTYQLTNKVDSRIGLTKKIIGLDFETF